MTPRLLRVVSLRSPWTVALAFVLALSVTGAAAYFLADEGRIREQKYQGLAAIAEMKAVEIAEWRHERLADAGRAAGSPFFRRALVAWLLDPADPELADL